MLKIMRNSAIGFMFLAGSLAAKDISWKFVGDLPAAKGYEMQIGVAGPLAGSLGEYVVIAGGANFPVKPVLEGGPKKNYPDIYLMKYEDGKLETVSHQLLPQETAQGSTISAGDKIYYLGGGTDSKEAPISKDILCITLGSDKKSLDIQKVGELPFTFTAGAAVIKDNKIYIAAGKQNGKDGKKFYEYDLATKATKELPEFPGKERSQPVGQILKNKDGKEMFYVFSGGANIAYTDGYAYDFAGNQWVEAAPVELNGKGISLLGASSVKLSDDEMLVIGGFNKEVYDNAVKNLSTLKDEQLKEFRNQYFTGDPNDFHWNKNMLVYNSKENRWTSIGEIPFQAPCGEGLVRIGDRIFSVNGEIKPGVRSERMYMGTIKD